MTTIFDQEVICPHCGVVFTVTALGSFGNASRTRDFMPKFWGLNPLRYFVYVCPVCDFADYSTAFETTDQPSEQSEPDSPTWKKFANVAEQRIEDEQDKSTPSVIAWAYLQGAWAARMVDRLPEIETQCRRQALNYFKLAIKQPADDQGESMYLCGELSRILGEFDAAIDYYKQVPKYANQRDEEKGIVALSREQIQVAKAKKSEVMIW